MVAVLLLLSEGSFLLLHKTAASNLPASIIAVILSYLSFWRPKIGFGLDAPAGIVVSSVGLMLCWPGRATGVGLVSMGLLILIRMLKFGS